MKRLETEYRTIPWDDSWVKLACKTIMITGNAGYKSVH